MGSTLTLAVVGARDVAKELGKKGTTSDLTLFNAVHDDHAVTLVEPTQFPERFPPLLYALAMSDRALFAIRALDREVAETAATLEMFDRPVAVRLGPAVGADELKRAFKGSPLETAPTEALDLVALRAEVDTWSAPEPEGPVLVPVDHAFPVKGVGTVALGVVRRGTLKAHDRLRLFPSEKIVEVRSVQVHDLDVREARPGQRVGMALKGVEADEIPRGHTLAPEGSLTVASELRGSAFVRSRYYRGPLGPVAQLQLLVGLQLVPARMTVGSDGDVQVAADRPVAFSPGDRMVLSDLSPPSGPRIVGRATLEV
ncbi:MAG TPA: EF-Tu/IF-2/RF-3 family GTPase [Thermoplasmata archaeon]